MISFKEKIKSIFHSILPVLVKKNHDYGDSNLIEDGLYGISIRMKDKINRLKNLCHEKPEVDESIEDTLEDIIGYSFNALRLINDKKLTMFGDNNPLETNEYLKAKINELQNKLDRIADDK